MSIPAFVINLHRSPDRLAFMTREAAAIGLTFERIPAVDGRAVPPDLRSQFLDLLSPLADGEIGCYASHLTVHQRLLNEGLTYALVLEDDVRLTPHLMEAAQAAVSAAPAGWDIIHLAAVLNRPVYAIADLTGGCHLVRYMRAPRNTAGYIISRSGAAKMLVPAPRIRPMDVDLKLAYQRGLDVLGVYPSPVIWGNHLPSAIWAPSMAQRARPQRKRPSVMETLRGHLYAARKLGLGAYIKCRLAIMRFALERSRGAVPVVRAISKPH